MKQYLDYMRNVFENGAVKGDRTGTGTTSLFGQTMRFDLRKGFPIVTTKFVPFRLVIAELIWFLSGSTNNEDLRRLNGNDKPTIWEEWALPDGDLGPIYGKQWRHYGGQPSGDGVPGHWEGGVDQIQTTIDMLRKSPNSRRLVISPWNPLELPDESMSPQDNVRAGRMALAPCHALFQFYVENNRLYCQMYQRSADSLLGVPFNISSYALLTHMVAQQCGLDVGEFIWVGGDCHVYSNHRTQVETQLAREPYPLPKLVIKRRPESIFDYRVEDFALEGYTHHPAISAPVAI